MAFLDGVKKTMCASESCKRHTEYTGGKFRLVNGQWYCHDCWGMTGSANPAKNLWDFTTTHFDGKPTHVKSLAHLHQLEKQYGVSNFAANYDQGKW